MMSGPTPMPYAGVGMAGGRNAGCAPDFEGIPDTVVGNRPEGGRRRVARGQGRKLRGDVVIPRIGIEHTLIPAPGASGVATDLRDVAQMAQRDEVFRIEREGALEDRARLRQVPGLVQRLAEDDVAAHVAGLLREELAAERDGLRQVARLPVLVGERGEVATRVLVELLPELVDPGRCAHPSSTLSLGGRQHAGRPGRRAKLAVVVQGSQSRRESSRDGGRYIRSRVCLEFSYTFRLLCLAFRKRRGLAFPTLRPRGMRGLFSQRSPSSRAARAVRARRPPNRSFPSFRAACAPHASDVPVLSPFIVFRTEGVTPRAAIMRSAAKYIWFILDRRLRRRLPAVRDAVWPGARP